MVDFFDFLAKIKNKYVNIRLLYFTPVTHCGRYEIASQLRRIFKNIFVYISEMLLTINIGLLYLFIYLFL